MGTRRRKIESPDVAALIRPHILASEIVESSHQESPSKLSVFLMENVPDDDMPRRRGLGGCGRTLAFAFKSGRWVFVGEGAWRS